MRFDLETISARLPPFFARLILRARGFWRERREPSAPLPEPAPAPEPPAASSPEPSPEPVPAKPEWEGPEVYVAKHARPDVEEGGAFYFRKKILDHLDTYFGTIERLKNADRDSYDLYSQIGATIVPNKAVGAAFEFPALWRTRKSRPGFGCVWLGAHEFDDGYIHPHFLYFNKVERMPPGVERVPIDWDVFRVSVYFDDPKPQTKKFWKRFFRKTGFLISYYVGMDHATDCRVLKTIVSEETRIDYRANGHNGGGKTRKKRYSIHLPSAKYDFSPHLVSWHKDDMKRFRNVPDIHKFGRGFLALAAHFALGNEAGVRVDARKDGSSISFAVDFKRTAYFFRDRETVINHQGKKARIFHIVRPHERVTKKRTLNIKFHFRGLRRFNWRGYDIVITVPGWHHRALMDFTHATVEFEEGQEVGEKLVSMQEIGQRVSDRIREAS